MENKYYTPEIEEFHVGFEFYMPVLREDNNGDLYRDKYCKHIWTEKNNMWEQFNLEHKSNGDTVISVPECLTVKYLGREDIESLGFEYDDIYALKGKFRIYKTLGYGENNYVISEYISVGEREYWSDRFVGTIKNKSELKRLLKQLGV